MQDNGIRTACRAATTGLFVLLLLLPSLDTVCGLDPAPEHLEKRKLAQFPSTGFDRAWPGRFEAWYNDHFGFRNGLITTDTAIKVLGLGISGVDWIEICPEGWLFLRLSHQLEDYRRKAVLTAAELAQWQRVLEGRRDWLAAQGIQYLFTVSPDKARIYPEKMHRALRPLPGPSRLDQLQKHLAAHSTFRIVDPTPALLANKARGQIYFRTDSHWNYSGAWLAYRELLRAGGKLLPGLAPHPLTAFSCAEILHGGDLAMALGLKGLVSERTVGVAPSYTPLPKLLPGCIMPRNWKRTAGTVTVLEGGNTLYRLMMFHDSFGEYLLYNVAAHFERSCFFWQNVKDPKVFKKYIVASKPHLVIEQRVERNLHQIPEW